MLLGKRDSSKFVHGTTQIHLLAENAIHQGERSVVFPIN